jgi:hypothetical protein
MGIRGSVDFWIGCGRESVAVWDNLRKLFPLVIIAIIMMHDADSAMTVARAIATLDYGPAPEAAGVSLEWIEAHGGRFGLFVGGAFPKPSGGEYLATVIYSTMSAIGRRITVIG